MTKTNKTTRKATKTRKTTKQTNKHVIPAKVKEYSGAPIPAVKVYRRKMTQFKNTVAHCWLLIGTDTYTFLNTYKDGILPASYDPKHYTYPLTPKAEKLITKKIEDFEDIEVDLWPMWIENAKRGGKKYDFARNPGQAIDAILKGRKRKAEAK